MVTSQSFKSDGKAAFVMRAAREHPTSAARESGYRGDSERIPNSSEEQHEEVHPQGRMSNRASAKKGRTDTRSTPCALRQLKMERRPRGYPA